MRRVALIATVLATMLAMAGCGASDAEESPDSTTDPQRIELNFEGSATPATERVAVDAGEEVELVVKSDEPGELHVHADPEQVLEYAAGTTSLMVTLEQPGVVDVERHEPEALVLQLEVG